MAPRSLEKLKTMLMQNLLGVTNKPYYGLIMSVVFSKFTLLGGVGVGALLSLSGIG